MLSNKAYTKLVGELSVICDKTSLWDVIKMSRERDVCEKVGDRLFAKLILDFSIG